MSANIYWRPVPKKQYDVPTDAPSSFVESLIEAFGRRLPITLGIEDIPTLRGMVAAVPLSQKAPYAVLIDAIEKHGTIEVFAEY